MNHEPSEPELIQLLKSPPVAAQYFMAAVQGGWLLAVQALRHLRQAGYPAVTVTKLRACPEAAFPPGVWGVHLEGSSENDTSLPADYTVMGLMLQGPRIGGPVIVLRLCRNDAALPGVFQSSAVTDVQGDTFQTANSVYEIKYL